MYSTNIYLEGNIASGKSTLLENLSNVFKDIFLYMEEPVKLWQNIGIFESYYADPKRWGLIFQMTATMTRCNNIIDINKLSNEGTHKKKVIIERSGLTDKYVFLPVMAERNELSDLEIRCYNICCEPNFRNYNFFTKRKIGFIYIKTDPEICQERFTRRSREGEKIDIDYLIKLHEKHETVLLPKIEELTDNVLIIDGNKDYVRNEIYKKELLQNIKSFIDNI